MESKPIDDIVRAKYHTQFDAQFYLENYFREVYPSEKFTLTKLQETFAQGKLKGPLRRCIDIGSGPVIHRLTAASKVCDTLVYSDFSANNRELVEDWLLNPVPHPRHHHLFQYCAKLEGFEDLEKGAIEIEERIKSKVDGVLSVNVLNAQPIGEVEQLYDVAFTGACLESACDSYDSYVQAVKNIGSILRTGGYLLIKGYLNGDFYNVNDTEFPCLNQNIDMVKKGLSEGGYRVIEMEEVDKENREPEDPIQFDVDNKGYSNCTSCFFAIAQKL